MGEEQPGFFNYVRSLCSVILFFLLLLLYTPFVIFLLLISFGKLTNFIMEHMVPPLGKAVMFVAGIHFMVKRHSGSIPVPALFIFNHSSTVDLLTILALGLPRIRFVAKWEFQYNPLFFILGRLTGQVFIKRQDSERAVETLKRSRKRIQKHQLSILMAPEGSRKHPGVIGLFKKGPFRMATDLGYPIVPIYFEGNRELSEGKLLLTRPGRVIAHIHPAIDTSGWNQADLDKHIGKIRNMYLHWAGVVDADAKR